VTNIGSGAFAYCSSLAQITIPDKVSSIGTAPFNSCTSLISINVDSANDFFMSVDGVLFDKANNVLIQYPGGKSGSFALPDGATKIGDMAFYNSAKLTGVSIPNSVTDIGFNAFGGCAALTEVVLPDKLTVLNNWTFGYCSSLTKVKLPTSLAYIGQEAFYDCGLARIVIPASVTNIDVYAFESCYKLDAVYFDGDAPSLQPYVFWDTPATVYYLPETTGWTSTFGDRPAILWNPHPQTSDGSFGVRSNRFGFKVAGTANIAFVVEACTNLAAASWVPIQQYNLTNGSVYFSDPNWANFPGRFYRIRSP
jgi:hypothetical protein